MKAYHVADAIPHRVDAVERGEMLRETARAAFLDEHIRLSIEGLKDFFFADWRPELVDLMVIAGAVEYCDLGVRRPALGWSRSIDLRIAVHDPKTWDAPPLRSALEEALNFLTGDLWQFSFTHRQNNVEKVGTRPLNFPVPDRIIMPYSDGLDSRAVAALVNAAEPKGGLVRVRLGSKGADTKGTPQRKRRFATVPFEVKLDKHDRVESSARSRGFKFAVITGIAASLANVDRIVVTESGQGALGPILASTGQTYPDYRVHPAFTRRVERLFEILTGKSASYEYPRIWHTKGETIAEANGLATPPSWVDTRSCWQDSRHVSFEGKRRQCGICAACMLRRMSMHRAAIKEAEDEYVWENLSSPTLAGGAVPGFSHHNSAFEQYAVAGILHLDHLAGLADSELHRRSVRRVARETADALGTGADDSERELSGLLSRHRAEWLEFQGSLGQRSFISEIAMVSPWQ